MAFSSEGLLIDGIGHFISDRYLKVPPNQRSYAWGLDNVQDLWQDILRAMEKSEEDYFIGTIVLSKTDDDDLEIVDGQQRLATTTIMLGAIRDNYLARDHRQRAELIEDNYLLTTDEDTLEKRSRISLNEADASFFESTIVNPPQNTSKRIFPRPRSKEVRELNESNKAIVLAGSKIQELVRKYLSGVNDEDAIGRLRRVTKYIKEHVKVIFVIVPNDEDAYTIFETLNDRGLELTKADLLKNHLLRTVKAKSRSANSKVADVLSKWDIMNGSLDAIGKRGATVEYIRYLWIATVGHVRERDLYKKIKQSVSEPGKATELAHSLARNSVKYAAILNSDHQQWSEFGEGMKTDLSNLITLGIDRMRPITLAVTSKFDKNELKKAISYLVCASVRILIASPAPGGIFEQRIAEIAPKVSSGSIKTAKALAKEMNERIVPRDKEFQAEFEVANVSREFLARYYLRAMENACDETEKFPSRVGKAISGTLEHIMPQSQGEAWKHIDKDTFKAYYKRIGNLALLAQKENEAAGDLDFATVKVPIYEKSNFLLTSRLASETDWGPTQIEERQKELASLAVKTWPIKVR